MKLILKAERDIEFSSLAALEKSIPQGIAGAALNYGQGEGQVKILNTVWGFYFYSGNTYYMQLEEGREKAEFIFELASSIAKALSSNFETSIELISIGDLEQKI